MVSFPNATGAISLATSTLAISVAAALTPVPIKTHPDDVNNPGNMRPETARGCDGRLMPRARAIARRMSAPVPSRNS
jgi:hypothetical protein